MPFPPGWGDDALSKHMGMAAHNTLTTFTQKNPQYERLAFVDRSFSTLWNNLPDQWVPWPAILMAKAQSGYKAACQLVISGQITESFPNLRTCLESCLYALHISKSECALNVWDSHYADNPPEQSMVRKFTKPISRESTKSISREFAIKKLKCTLEKTDPKLRPLVGKLYQQAIDLGAHPNPKAIYPNLVAVQGNEKIEFAMQTLHGDSEFLEYGMEFATEIGLACLLIVGNVFSECFKRHEIDVAIMKVQETLPSQKKLHSRLLTK